MFAQIALGVGVNMVTIVAVVAMLEFVSIQLSRKSWFASKGSYVRAGMIIGGLVTWVLCALSVAIWTWAIVFHLLKLFSTFEQSMYFSLVTFTTLGFGDILSPRSWRIFTSMTAVNGLLLFGLVTAFLIQQIQQHQLLNRP